MVFAREKHKVRVISNDRYFRHPVSQTFHGRDIFAPVAARVAAGLAPARIGEIITDYVRPVFERPRQTGAGMWAGSILAIDRFGNVVTNFYAKDFPKFTQMTIGRAKVRGVVRSYADAPAGELVAIVGSAGYIEISVKQDSAAVKIGARAGQDCQLRLK